MTRQTTSTTASPAAVLWADGELFVDEPLPHDLQLHLGAELGLSPVTHVGLTHVGRAAWTEAHLRVLGAAAGVLGYDGFAAATLRERLGELPQDGRTHDGLPDARWTVSLVPTPENHRAMPPGTNWTVEVESFDPHVAAGASGPLRVAVGAFRRNQTSAAANILLRDDAELWAGAVRDPLVDATLWLDLDGHVACVDQHCLIARIDGRLVTPSLDHGALRTAPRHVLVTSAGGPARDSVRETTIVPSDLLGADAVVCLTPWGSVLPIGDLHARVYDVDASRALVDSIESLLAEGAR